MTQILQPLEHQHFLCKLMGYQFIVQCKLGVDNRATYALSHMTKNTQTIEIKVLSMNLLTIQFLFLEELRAKNNTSQNCYYCTNN